MPYLSDGLEARICAGDRYGRGPRTVIGSGARTHVDPGERRIDAAQEPRPAHQRDEHTTQRLRALKAASVDDDQPLDKLGTVYRQSSSDVTADRIANQHSACGSE